MIGLTLIASPSPVTRTTVALAVNQIAFEGVAAAGIALTSFTSSLGGQIKMIGSASVTSLAAVPRQAVTDWILSAGIQFACVCVRDSAAGHAGAWAGPAWDVNSDQRIAIKSAFTGFTGCSIRVIFAVDADPGL